MKQIGVLGYPLLLEQVAPVVSGQKLVNRKEEKNIKNTDDEKTNINSKQGDG